MAHSMNVRQMLDILIDYSENKLMFKMPPRMITRHDMMAHFKDIGHSLKDISTLELAMHEIRCPIYMANERKEMIFNNYLCYCGLLFIFPAKIQKMNGAAAIYPYYNSGVSPCTTCLHYMVNIGCIYDPKK